MIQWLTDTRQHRQESQRVIINVSITDGNRTMKTGNMVIYGGQQFQILAEYDDEFIYLAVGNDGAQLVAIADCKPVKLN